MPSKAIVTVTRLNEDGSREELCNKEFTGVMVMGRFIDKDGDPSRMELVERLSVRDIVSMLLDGEITGKAMEGFAKAVDVAIKLFPDEE